MGRTSSCERVRHWATLAPDSVLSLVEQRLLEAHTERCDACRNFAAEVAGIASALRAAPLEKRTRIAPFRAPARRRRPRFSYVSGAAGVAATVVVSTIAATSIVAFGTGSHQPVQIDRPAIVVDATSMDSNAERSKFLLELRDYSHARAAGEVAGSRSHGPGLISG